MDNPYQPPSSSSENKVLRKIRIGKVLSGIVTLVFSSPLFVRILFRPTFKDGVTPIPANAADWLLFATAATIAIFLIWSGLRKQ
jgi:hypothetical protein